MTGLHFKDLTFYFLDTRVYNSHFFSFFIFHSKDSIVVTTIRNTNLITMSYSEDTIIMSRDDDNIDHLMSKLDLFGSLELQVEVLKIILQI